jgi:general secretion pathway protein G
MRRWGALLLLAALFCARSDERPTPAMREAALVDSLRALRMAIDNFRQDKGRYPSSLENLVPNYIRRIPADPITGSATTWKVTTEETVRPSEDFTTSGTATSETVIIDVRSGAPGVDSKGTRYSDY